MDFNKKFGVSNGQSNVITCKNYMDGDNPAGGYAHGPGMCISWQDGPRGKDEHGNLQPASGAFVEDALVAALQRLHCFQNSKFAHPANARAIELINEAIGVLNSRSKERAARGVLGANVV